MYQFQLSYEVNVIAIQNEPVLPKIHIRFAFGDKIQKKHCCFKASLETNFAHNWILWKMKYLNNASSLCSNFSENIINKF